MLLDVRTIFHRLKKNLGNFQIVILIVALCASLIGCSSSGGNSSPVEDSTPADGAQDVSILKNIIVHLKQPLDVSLLNEASATLIASDGSETLTLMPGFISENNTLVLATPRPLRYAAQYHLRVEGLHVDQDTVLTEFEFSFTTHGIPTQV